MPERRYRVLAVAAHPVQYMAPIFRRMAKHPALDLHVAYCSLRGAEAGHDPEFGASIKWDVPLLDGYSWSEIPNRGSGGESFFGLRNPGLCKLIRSGNYDAVLCFTGYRNATFWIAYFAARQSGSAFLFGADTTTLTPQRMVLNGMQPYQDCVLDAYLWLFLGILFRLPAISVTSRSAEANLYPNNRRKWAR